MIAVIAGTRPEAIKLAPVVAALRASGAVAVRYIATGQHRDLFRQALGDGPLPDIDMKLMQRQQSPAKFLVRAASALKDALAATNPALVIVHGDTASAYAGAIAAYRLGCPIAHVEAGLRTRSIDSPFPEELFRRAISRLATLHLAPTERARDALLREGVARSTIHVTGNTGIDRLHHSLAGNEPAAAQALLEQLGTRPFVLVTIHRRENRGVALETIARGLRRIANELGVAIVLPLHPSPGLKPLTALLAEHSAIHLCPPLDPVSTAWLVRRAALVLTDSGGLQEEAVTLGTPVIVLRRETERAEAVEASRALLAGSDEGQIVLAAREMLGKGRFPPSTLYGDGNAAGRIGRILEEWLAPTAGAR